MSKEIKLSRTEFLLKFAETVCITSKILYEIVKHASNYTVSIEHDTEIMKCYAYHNAYEIDSELGCYRFQCKGVGPWTRWIPCER